MKRVYVIEIEWKSSELEHCGIWATNEDTAIAIAAKYHPEAKRFSVITSLTRIFV